MNVCAVQRSRGEKARCSGSERRGGGAYNKTLIRWIADRLPGVDVRTHEDFGIPSEAKEPMAFALLAYLFAAGLPGNVPGATGAARQVVLGVCAPGSSEAP